MDATTHWFDDAAERARKLITNAAYRDFAAKMATSNPFAIDYLLQAPVLVAAACMGFTQSHHSYDQLRLNEVAYEFGKRCKEGPKLRELLASYKIAYPFRALKGSVICPSKWLAISVLSTCDMHPSALAQAIPERAAGQRVWLKELMAWGAQMNVRNNAFCTGLPWAAKALGAVDQRRFFSVDIVADFYLSNRDSFNQKWSFEEAMSAAERWHRQLAKASFAEAFAATHGIGFTDKVHYDPLPTECVIDDLHFVALDSGEELFYEGQAMHHCVASYARDVITGKARIYSIRRKEERVATLELAWIGFEYVVVQLKGPCNRKPDEDVLQAARKFPRDLPPSNALSKFQIEIGDVLKARSLLGERE